MNKFDEAINYVNYMNETYLEHTKRRSGQTGFGQWTYLVKKELERGKKLEELVKLYQLKDEAIKLCDLAVSELETYQAQELYTITLNKIKELEREI